MNINPEEEKIFCIGLSKTGTTSLARALEILGYKVRDNIGVTRFVPGDLSCIDEMELLNYDAFTDTPIPSFYRELDEKFPNAKFILTIRELVPWLKSCKKQFTRKHAESRHQAVNDLFIDMYGCSSFEEEKFAAGYKRFAEGVQEYFRDRPDDLLVFAPCDGEGWEKLCRFLGSPVPDTPFPVTNVTGIQWLRVEEVVAIAREAGKKIPAADSFVVPKAGSTKTGRLLSLLPGRLQNTIIRRRRDKLPTQLKAASATIAEKLAALQVSIPVLSGGNGPPPYPERKNWAHLWLVDILERENDLLAGDQEYSINIALIENGAVRMGVVYFPESDTVYCSRNGRESYRQAGADNTMEKLPLDPGNTELPILSTSGTIPEDLRVQYGISGNPPAVVEMHNAPLALCRIAEGKARMFISDGPFREWEVAAAHAVAKGAGKTIVMRTREGTERYNTEYLTVDYIVAQ